jgi:hypothetical protein
VAGELAINTTDGRLYYKDTAGVVQTIASKAGALGDVVGPASATDNAVARFDATTGKIIQNSVVTIADSTGNMAGVGTISSGAITSSSLTSGRVLYAGTSGLIQDDADFTFNGTTVTMANDASISGLTVGKGGGSNSGSNSVFGLGAGAAATTADGVVAIGQYALSANTTGANTAVGYRAMAFSNTTGTNNTAIGQFALVSNTTASYNTAVGYQSFYGTNTAGYNTGVGVQVGYSNTSGSGVEGFGYRSLYANTTGSNNVGYGTYSLTSNTTGASNVGIGTQALYANTTASNNTAVGYQAAYSNTTGFITAVGYVAGYSNTTGTGNSAMGWGALYTNSTGSANTAIGSYDSPSGTSGALRYNITGSYNTALGSGSLGSNTTASNNTAVGYQAGYSTTTGQYNTALGHTALYTNTTGAYNVAVGYQSLYSANNVTGQNVGLGWATGYSVTTGTNNTFIGHSSGYYVTTGSKNSVLGNYSGYQVNLDIRAASNYSVISDGDGNRHLTSANGFSTALGNNAVPNSGTGITFPATQSASSDANTLDDYEEGTFSPSVSLGSGSVTTQFMDWSYTKIGNVVFVTGQFNIATVSSPSGTVAITGLPFTVKNTYMARGALAVAVYGGFAAGLGTKPITAQISENTTQISLATQSGGTTENLGAYLQANSFCTVSGCYITA